jgi:hypothetical protein
MRSVLAATLAILALAACGERDDIVFGGASGLSIVWPSTTRALTDDSTFAVAIFRTIEAEPGTVTFVARLDNGAPISGIRRELNPDSVVLFPLQVLSDGEHTLRVEASTGATTQISFNRQFQARPRISLLDRDSANAGQSETITIFGQNLAGDFSVFAYLNGVLLPITDPGDTEMTVSIPDGVWSGLISVEVDRRISPDVVPLRIVNGTAPLGPQIRHVVPNAAPRYAPVLIYGLGFAEGDIPTFSGRGAGAALLNFELRQVAPIGSVASAVTIVPASAGSLNTSVVVTSAGNTSNPFTFYIQ